MAAPPIPPIRLGLIGTGLAVEKPHWPALRTLADRYEVTALTDSSAAPSDLKLNLVLTGGAIGNYTAILLGAPRDAQQLRRHHSHESLPRYRQRLPR
jgi:predicted dehydrogenase